MVVVSFYDNVAYIKGNWIWELSPVYHRHGRFDAQEEENIGRVRATCGLILEEWSHESGRTLRSSVAMRRKHADCFARPCKKCWRNGR